MDPTLVVLAAGIGSRYGGLKQIDPVGPANELILDYSVYDAVQAGFGKLVFVIRERIADEFREAIGSRFENRMEVSYVFQELDDIPGGVGVTADRTKPWGTGHAVLTARAAVTTPFAVINADDFYGSEGYRVLARFLAQAAGRTPPEYALVGYVLRNTLSEHGHVARGVCSTDDQDLLTGIAELTRIERGSDGVCNTAPDGSITQLSGDERVSMNLWGFDVSIFDHLERLFAEFLQQQGGDPKAEFFLPAAVDSLLRDAKATCRLLPTDAQWTGVTYQDDRPSVIAFVRERVERGDYPSPLWSDA